MKETLVRKAKCHCGGFVYLRHRGESWKMFCSNCHDQTKVYDSYDKAIQAWERGERVCTNHFHSIGGSSKKDVWQKVRNK